MVDEGQAQILEVDPEVILRQIAHALEAAIPGIALMPQLGDPQPASAIFDADELAGDDADLSAGGREIRSLGMSIAHDREPWGGFDTTTSDTTANRWVSFAEQLLSHIQEVITVATTSPWPEIRVDGRRTHASCNVALEGRFLRMWFAAREEPILVFERVEVIKGAVEDENDFLDDDPTVRRAPASRHAQYW